MRVTVVGAGWVGVVSAAVFAHFGHEVTCTDILEERIVALQKGDLPFFEPDLALYITKGMEAGRLAFAIAHDATVKDADIVMCAVGTPPRENGAADVSGVLAAARQFGRAFTKKSVFVIKSTVPPGTGEACREIILEEMRLRHTDLSFAVASNPEFLSEGTAIQDSLTPERVILGCTSDRCIPYLEELYAPLKDAGIPFVFMDVPSAEMTKYAANAFLATKISFINEIANYAEYVHADPWSVAKGIGLDSRIGKKFLRPGVGYGGSCFPKDVRGLIAAGNDAGYRFKILPEVDRVNTFQRVRLYEKLALALQGVKGKRVAILGLAYKPNTDDIRESPALYFLDRLTTEGAEVIAYDPMVRASILRVFPQVKVAEDFESAVRLADATVLLTEWAEFQRLSPLEIRQKMRGSVIVDGRGVWREEKNEVIS